MSISGSLRTMPVEDLLDWIDRRFACGRLTLERAGMVRSFEFDSGYVTHASSNDPAEQLGRLLVRRGLVGESALEEAFGVRGDTGVSFGKILLMTGALAEDQLRGVLEDKIVESLCDAYVWTDGEFRFDPDEGAATSEFEVSINLRVAMEQGAERAAELRSIRELIPDDGLALYLRDRRAAGDPPDSDVARLLDAVERGASVGDIVLEHDGYRFQVLQGLAYLIRAGAVALDRRSATRSSEGTESAEELEEAARGRAAGGDRSGALELASRALAEAPDDPSVQKLYRDIERSLFAELSRDFLTRFCVPRLLKSEEELETLDMSDTERYLVGRIDGRWDLLSLMRVAPLREVEVLITFKQLADRGIVSL